MIKVGGKINIQNWTEIDKKALTIATEAFETVKPDERQSFQRYLENAYHYLTGGKFE